MITAELGEAYRHERKYMKKIVALLMAVLSLTTASATVLKDHYEKIKGMTGVEVPIPTQDNSEVVSMVGTVILVDSVYSVVKSLPTEYQKEVKKAFDNYFVYIYAAQSDEMESEVLLFFPAPDPQTYAINTYLVVFAIVPNDSVEDFIKQPMGE